VKFEFKDFFKRLLDKNADDDIVGNAAQIAFYFTFALFPLLLFLMSLLGIVLSDKQGLQDELFVLLGRIMPASAYDLVRTTLDEVRSNSSSGKLTIGILVTLWSASAGVDNMRGTLNEIYNLKETRSWYVAKLTSLLLTLGIGVLILAGLAFIVYGSQLINAISPTDSPYIAQALQIVVILCLMLLGFALVYNFAPNHAPLRWKWITPGSAIGVVLWLALSGAFRLYLHYFNSYAATYGSLGAVIILLLWLYLTALVILIGGAINAIFDEKSGTESGPVDPKQVSEERKHSGKKSKT
jgi:membrane protein